MKTVEVVAGQARYSVLIGAGALADEALPGFAEGIGKALVVSDTQVHGLHGSAALEALRGAVAQVHEWQLPAGEASKSWASAQSCCDLLAELKFERQDLVVSLGGGVVSDLAGFVAAIYNRGVRHLALPTTLLAQVDASVGGKTGINIEAGKNLVGAFHQPACVVADVATLATLSPLEFSNGMAEVVKHGLLDRQLHEYLDRHADELAKRNAADPQLLEELVYRNVSCKARIVEADERESGVRAFLNLGHTFAHALEAVLGYGTIMHGQAVAIGLVAACRLAAKMGCADPALESQVERSLVNLELPVRFPAVDSAVLIETMKRDKKVKSGQMRFVLPKEVGDVFVSDDVAEDDVKAVIGELQE